ncbi:MAG: glycosyltransferase family 4 protein [Candidatus Nanoarchaeia archaeon]
MKILIICPDWFPSISGFGTSAYEFASRLKKEGHQVKIITPHQKNLDKKSLDVTSVKVLVNPLKRNPLVFGLYNKIKKSDCEVILLYSYMFEMNARVALYKKLGLIKKPIILMYRGSLEKDVLPLLNWKTRTAKKAYDSTLARLLFKNVDHTISNSKPTLKTIQELYKIKNQKLTYIPNAVNVKTFSVSKQNNKRVIFIGRLIENKGIKFFSKIAEQIPSDWTFTIVGDGPLRKEVLALEKKYKNVEFKGQLNHEQTKKILSKSDILILPTFAEGSPRAILEACASGVPSVSFDVGDVSELLKDNKNGYAIKKYDLEEFVKKMCFLITKNKERQTKGKNARAYAEKNLDWDVVYKQMTNTISKITKNKTKK